MQDDVASIETLRGTMLKIDTFTAYLTNRNFIVHEKDFEVDLLPTILEVPRIPKFESFPKEFQRQWLLMEDLTPLSQFYYSYHVNAIRMMRRLVYFSRLNQHNYSTSELSAIIMNFHNYLMEFYAKIPIKYLPYNSMEDFEQGSEPPTLKDNASELLFRLTPLKLHICMFATLHSTAISHGLNLSYSVSYGSSKLYKSSDILLLSIRTFKFLISRNPCGDVQFVHSLQYGVPAWLSYEVSAAVKKGLEAYGDPAYLREAVEIIGNSIHPDVSVVGWMWPIASHSACKMHKLLRQ
ncbi:hypothetical protein HDV02_006257 [Globomyces sp. JEL0801]|nr:hypothetical protein HDV02_006257 [Globomyces sp. JEL0801]